MNATKLAMEANEVESGARDCDHWNCGEAFPGESSLFFAGPSRAFLGASFAKLRRFTGSSVSAHKAIIYLRQFSRQQVKHNKQSQRLQYALVEYNNIVAHWVPKKPFTAGSAWSFQYRLTGLLTSHRHCRLLRGSLRRAWVMAVLLV